MSLTSETSNSFTTGLMRVHFTGRIPIRERVYRDPTSVTEPLTPPARPISFQRNVVTASGVSVEVVHLVPRNNEGQTAWDNGDYEDEGFIPFYPPPRHVNVVVASFQVDNEERTCSVCLNATQEDTNICILSCSHVFCVGCIHQWVVQQRSRHCPMCRTVIDNVQVQTVAVADRYFRMGSLLSNESSST